MNRECLLLVLQRVDVSMLLRACPLVCRAWRDACHVILNGRAPIIVGAKEWLDDTLCSRTPGRLDAHYTALVGDEPIFSQIVRFLLRWKPHVADCELLNERKLQLHFASMQGEAIRQGNKLVGKDNTYGLICDWVFGALVWGPPDVSGWVLADLAVDSAIAVAGHVVIAGDVASQWVKRRLVTSLPRLNLRVDTMWEEFSKSWDNNGPVFLDTRHASGECRVYIRDKCIAQCRMEGVEKYRGHGLTMTPQPLQEKAMHKIAKKLHLSRECSRSVLHIMSLPEASSLMG